MPGNDLENLLASLIEELAAIEHERWAHWQSYVHEHGSRREDGSVVIPAELVHQWERQMSTPYDELREDEKASDREQVARYLPLIRSRLQAWNGA